jgi:DNA repair protein RecN (Recombination protein N)
MLRRLVLKDYAIVRALEVDLTAGFTVLTGETGAGKSILIDALQLALGGRADARAVREGAPRAEVVAEFDLPQAVQAWLIEAGFDPVDEGLLLRRVIDVQGRSRAWINGGVATVAQLRELADHLVEIHGQHAWQSLTRPAAVRALLDAQAGVDTQALQSAWAAWRDAQAALSRARSEQSAMLRERERLQWQLSELDPLAPQPDEWAQLDAEHTRLAHAQALLEAAAGALQATSEAEPSADALAGRAAEALEAVARYDPQLEEVVQVLQSAQAQLQDAAHTLRAYLAHHDPDPGRLAELDRRMSTWLQLARRHRRAPAELPALWQEWQAQLQRLDAIADEQTLARAEQQARQAFEAVARQVSAARQARAPLLAAAITQAMQQLGMAGGRFEIHLPALDAPAAHGLEEVEFRVAGHAGASPQPLARVASGGELSRLALAIAATTARGRRGADTRATLIFDEIDAGVGGAVGDAVGRMMKQLGADAQVLAVTHLAQVAACADAHLVVAKTVDDGRVSSSVRAVLGEARVAEVARMLGGERLADTSRAHAQALLGGAA